MAQVKSRPEAYPRVLMEVPNGVFCSLATVKSTCPVGVESYADHPLLRRLKFSAVGVHSVGVTE